MGYKSTNKWLIKSIKDNYEGIIVDTFSTNRTFIFKILNKQGDTITISSSTLTDEFYRNIHLKIRINKPKNENYVFFSDSTDKIKKVFYEKISWKDREHSTFPKEWKNKWLESSEWDTKR
jgi:hypothetical protein